MTSIENMADEIMRGLHEYSDIADDAMKKAVIEELFERDYSIFEKSSEGI